MNTLRMGGGDGQLALDMTPSPRQAANNPVSICGWLHKMKKRQRALLPAWVQRWFTVEDGRLQWYRSKSEHVARGFIDLRTVTSIKEFESGKEGSYSFVIYSEERTLLLRAVNKRDLDRWVNQLRLQLDYIRGSPVEKSLPGTSRAAFDRRDMKVKSKTGYDKVLGRLDAALEHLCQLEEEVTRVNPHNELVIDEEGDAEDARRKMPDAQQRSNSASSWSSRSSEESKGSDKEKRRSGKARKAPPPPAGAPVRRRPSLPTERQDSKDAQQDERQPHAQQGEFNTRQLVDVSSRDGGGSPTVRRSPSTGRTPPPKPPMRKGSSASSNMDAEGPRPASGGSKPPSPATAGRRPESKRQDSRQKEPRFTDLDDLAVHDEDL